VWQWGADYVRLQLDQELWLADCPATLGAAATTYRGALQSTVNGLTARGITVLLSLSVTQRDTDTGCTPSSAPFAKEMADSRSVDFWSAVASAYKGNLLVQFDLFNEPNNVSDAVWRDGGAVSYSTTVNGVRQSMTFQTPGMQALYDTVRSAGATNLVFVAGGGWGTNVDALYRAPLDGYGIVGSTHVYCNNCTAENPHLPANLEVNNSARVLARYPVVMTESGWEQSQDGTFNKASLEWAESHVDGWVMHMFYTGSFSLLQSWTTKLPNVKGIPVWNALQANRVARGFAAQPL
jgi:endoglucanase